MFRFGREFNRIIVACRSWRVLYLCPGFHLENLNLKVEASELSLKIYSLLICIYLGMYIMQNSYEDSLLLATCYNLGHLLQFYQNIA